MYTVKFLYGRDTNTKCDTLADAVLIASLLSKQLGEHYDVTIWQGNEQHCLFRNGKELL